MLPEPVRYERDTPEFARVANLSDAVFAIAVTLMVLTLDTPAVATGALGGALGDQAPQLIAFVLAFALVANLWWQHHKLMALFQFVEPGMVGIVLALLGGVALVPYPTSLVGNTDAVAPDGRPVGAGADDHPGTSPRAAAGRHRLINRYLPDE